MPVFDISPLNFRLILIYRIEKNTFKAKLLLDRYIEIFNKVREMNKILRLTMIIEAI